ncbi:SDR family NAD(P)-dependent oxidoreductase [Epibacterium sp. SM1969]|uniref:SDR family NAD(P)-dependent oxidoreductase n=1 Tax=Tritonibacter aquimaris TaxID=2663379 RepID=A0A844ARX9_9RHOB|nr:SDR family oxidoreductase [Tritonibacter aquimaris]MQY41948.1 SDR family NAD(P)-dependent oxidoreductase [Tritonibacter aquimaris]
MGNTLLCLGFGYSAQALARKLVPDGWRVVGTNRTGEHAEGFKTVRWPGNDLPLDGVTHVLSSIAPTAEGDPVLADLLQQLGSCAPDWVGYLSTTAVYGDHDGAWVDEDTPLTPATRRGHWRKEAEEAWLSSGLPVHVFRLAGIYGPGRGPFSKVKSGQARRIVKPGQVFSRIHVEDIAQVLAASIAQPNPGSVYNVCDDFPAPPQDVIGYAAELLGLPKPPEVDFDTADMSPMARSFYSENKKVQNARIKSELGVELLYPDYRVGLQALARDS